MFKKRMIKLRKEWIAEEEELEMDAVNFLNNAFNNKTDYSDKNCTSICLKD